MYLCEGNYFTGFRNTFVKETEKCKELAVKIIESLNSAETEMHLPRAFTVHTHCPGDCYPSCSSPMCCYQCQLNYNQYQWNESYGSC